MSLLAPQPLPPRTRGVLPLHTKVMSPLGPAPRPWWAREEEVKAAEERQPHLALPCPLLAGLMELRGQHVWPLKWRVWGHLELSLVNLPGAAGWPHSHPLLAWPVLPARPAFAGRPACPICARSVPAGAGDALGISPGDRYRPRLQRLRLRGLH